ncbi:MAG: hypothetical protein AB1600_02505 [Bacteroidota bacterium]
MKPKSFLSTALDNIDHANVPTRLKELIKKVSSAKDALGGSHDKESHDKHDHWNDEPRHDHHRDKS